MEGFTKSRKVLKAITQNHQVIKLPSGYIPKHVFPDSTATVENRDSENKKNRLTSKERGLMYGESSKTLKDVNQWALKWDIKKTPEEDNGGKETSAKGESAGKENEKETK